MNSKNSRKGHNRGNDGPSNQPKAGDGVTLMPSAKKWNKMKQRDEGPKIDIGADPFVDNAEDAHTFEATSSATNTKAPVTPTRPYKPPRKRDQATQVSNVENKMVARTWCHWIWMATLRLLECSCRRAVKAVVCILLSIFVLLFAVLPLLWPSSLYSGPHLPPKLPETQPCGTPPVTSAGASPSNKAPWELRPTSSVLQSVLSHLSRYTTQLDIACSCSQVLAMPSDMRHGVCAVMNTGTTSGSRPGHPDDGSGVITMLLDELHVELNKADVTREDLAKSWTAMAEVRVNECLVGMPGSPHGGPVDKSSSSHPSHYISIYSMAARQLLSWTAKQLWSDPEQPEPETQLRIQRQDVAGKLLTQTILTLKSERRHLAGIARLVIRLSYQISRDQTCSLQLELNKDLSAAMKKGSDGFRQYRTHTTLDHGGEGEAGHDPAVRSRRMESRRTSGHAKDDVMTEDTLIDLAAIFSVPCRQWKPLGHEMKGLLRLMQSNYQTLDSILRDADTAHQKMQHQPDGMSNQELLEVLGRLESWIKDAARMHMQWGQREDTVV